MGGSNLKALILLQHLLLIISLLDYTEGFLGLFDVLLNFSHLVLEGLHSLLLVTWSGGGSINATNLRAICLLDLLRAGLHVCLFG